MWFGNVADQRSGELFDALQGYIDVPYETHIATTFPELDIGGWTGDATVDSVTLLSTLWKLNGDKQDRSAAEAFDADKENIVAANTTRIEQYGVSTTFSRELTMMPNRASITEADVLNKNYAVRSIPPQLFEIKNPSDNNKQAYTTSHQEVPDRHGTQLLV